MADATSGISFLQHVSISKCRQFALGFVVATFLFLGILSYTSKPYLNRAIVGDGKPTQTPVQSGQMLQPQSMEMSVNAKVKIHNSNKGNGQRLQMQGNKHSDTQTVDMRRKSKEDNRLKNIPRKFGGRTKTSASDTNTNLTSSDLTVSNRLLGREGQWSKTNTPKKVSDQLQLTGGKPWSQTNRRRSRYQRLQRRPYLENGSNTNISISLLLNKKPQHVADQTIWNQMVKYFPELFRFQQDFLPKYKNPCFLEGGLTRCLPYFYLGGAPKCGTTDLWFNLLRHSDVFGGLTKEPHFWKMPKSYKAVARYLQHFNKFVRTVSENPNKGTRLIVGDGSASTLWANTDIVMKSGIKNKGEIPFVHADVIQAIQPAAKFIFILREPTNRSISEYFAFSGTKSPEHFHKNTVKQIKRFKGCLRSRSLRTCANVLESTRVYPRIHVSVYIAHIREWLRVFPKEQILILRTEDWHYHKERNLLQNVFKFLDIESLPENRLKPLTNQHALKNLKQKQVTQQKSAIYGEILPETRKILDEFYAPFNKQLATFLQDDRFLWKT